MARPSVGARTVERILTIVVLPEPLGPRSPKTWPVGTCSETPSRARNSPLLNVRTISVVSTENSDMAQSLGRPRYVADVRAKKNRYFLFMAISESEIAQVRSATDIVALISETVALKKSGRRWTGLCPFHGEKTPSFSVNAEEGRYYCFGCRASGDQITFVREMQHLDFVEALRLLADRAGIELHEDANAGPARKERQEYMATMERAVEWYHDRLLTAPDARAAREYLKSRGIDGEVARQFKLGWAPDEWDALAKSLQLNEKQLLGTGLGFVNKGDRRQDALRARIIFPIFDTTGKAIAVGGRIMPSAPVRPDGRVD